MGENWSFVHELKKGTTIILGRFLFYLGRNLFSITPTSDRSVLEVTQPRSLDLSKAN